MSKISYRYATPLGTTGTIVCKVATSKKSATYRGAIGVYEDGKLLWSKVADIFSLNPIDAMAVAQDLASHEMAKNNINAFIVSHY